MAWDILGHEWAVSLLQRHLSMGQVRHAYLFTGPDSVGKRSLAIRFAQALNCEAPPAPGEFCGKCRSCQLIPAGTYPDLHIVEAEDVGGVLKVDQVRQLQRQLALAPFEGRWRIALLLRFHEATASYGANAANALLKTLEEPAPKVVLLLTARSSISLLPTIVSRCEVIPLRALPMSQIEAALKARGETEERSELIAGLSEGRPGWALQMAEDPGALSKRTSLADDLLTLLVSDRGERFEYCERFDPRVAKKALKHVRQNALETLEVWASLWRDVMMQAFGVSASPRNAHRFQDIKNLAAGIRHERVLEMLEATLHTRDAMERNVNVQLAMETLMLDMPKIKSTAS
jgi:DNA polymerase-3 subunit delta'